MKLAIKLPRQNTLYKAEMENDKLVSQKEKFHSVSGQCTANDCNISRTIFWQLYLYDAVQNSIYFFATTLQF